MCHFWKETWTFSHHLSQSLSLSVYFSSYLSSTWSPALQPAAKSLFIPLLIVCATLHNRLPAGGFPCSVARYRIICNAAGSPWKTQSLNPYTLSSQTLAVPARWCNSQVKRWDEGSQNARLWRWVTAALTLLLKYLFLECLLLMR